MIIVMFQLFNFNFLAEVFSDMTSFSFGTVGKTKNKDISVGSKKLWMPFFQLLFFLHFMD